MHGVKKARKVPRQATKFHSHSSFPFFCTGPRQADNTAKRTWAKMAVQAGWVAAGPFVRLNQGKTEPKKTRKHGFCSLTLKEELSFQGERGCLRAIRKKQTKSGGKATNNGVTRRYLGKWICYIPKREENEENCFISASEMFYG